MGNKLSGLLERLVNRNGLTVSVTGAADENVAAVADTLAKTLPAHDLLPKAEIQPWGKRKEGIVIPADITFAIMGGNVKTLGGKFSGQMQLAAQIISLGYLWNAIRVQGGAYGAGMVARDTGLTACYSYRDPNGAGSVESYRNCASFLRGLASQTSDFTGFIIGTVANGSPLMTPKTKAQTGDRLYFTQTTWEDRCRIRKELLSATPADLIAIADILEKAINDGGICMVGGKEKLDKCGELETVITL
jgi:Zn-dependent M16 (insulinase) family peptidase